VLATGMEHTTIEGSEERSMKIRSYSLSCLFLTSLIISFSLAEMYDPSLIKKLDIEFENQERSVLHVPHKSQFVRSSDEYLVFNIDDFVSSPIAGANSPFILEGFQASPTAIRWIPFEQKDAILSMTMNAPEKNEKSFLFASVLCFGLFAISPKLVVNALVSIGTAEKVFQNLISPIDHLANHSRLIHRLTAARLSWADPYVPAATATGFASKHYWRNGLLDLSLAAVPSERVAISSG
jgi:hypothetical protein